MEFLAELALEIAAAIGDELINNSKVPKAVRCLIVTLVYLPIIAVCVAVALIGETAAVLAGTILTVVITAVYVYFMLKVCHS